MLLVAFRTLERGDVALLRVLAPAGSVLQRAVFCSPPLSTNGMQLSLDVRSSSDRTTSERDPAALIRHSQCFPHQPCGDSLPSQSTYRTYTSCSTGPDLQQSSCPAAAHQSQQCAHICHSPCVPTHSVGHLPPQPESIHLLSQFCGDLPCILHIL